MGIPYDQQEIVMHANQISQNNLKMDFNLMSNVLQ